MIIYSERGMSVRKGEILMKGLGIWTLAVSVMILVVPALIVLCLGIGTEEHDKSNIVKVLFHQIGEVRQLPFEEYIAGVVAAEMPASFETEALKAQAVAARTYTLTKMKVNDSDINGAHKGADICTDYAHCQAYIAWENAEKNWGNDANKNRKRIESAVGATAGVVMTYEEEPIRAVFHSSSGGRTENSADVWGGNLPYLKSVDSPGEEIAPTYTSQVVVPLEEFKKKIMEACPDAQLDDINDMFGNAHRSVGNGVKDVEIGKHVFLGTEIRRLFGLRSTDFSLNVEDGNVIFSVKGNGHGVGMSQYGANHMASQGKGYEEILTHYYTGVRLEKMNERQ
ncbi:MAG: stage II sporulation protein D [Ruminococcaceae bacterium]|nr:stage II sporulation protein D [Oscillospiraceae bacterium]